MSLHSQRFYVDLPCVGTDLADAHLPCSLAYAIGIWGQCSVFYPLWLKRGLGLIALG